MSRCRLVLGFFRRPIRHHLPSPKSDGVLQRTRCASAVSQETELQKKDAAMATCLFTGNRLTATTKMEHTIPRSVAGRIRSRDVSCDLFNELCGQRYDPFLARRYVQLMNILSPLLSHEHQTGLLAVDVPGEPDGLVLDGGAITRRNLVILERDPVSGKPRSAAAEDPRAIARIEKQAGWTSMTRKVIAPMEGDIVFVRKVPAILAELEIALLKSALLTFDHLLGGANASFARHDRLTAVRAFIKRAVIAEEIDSIECNRFSLGYQYEKAGLYRKLRKRMPIRETEFEHVLFAAGNASYRTVDLVWVVFGFDPFGFRLCVDWDGGDFAFGVVNGVFANTSASEMIPLGLVDDLLCCPTHLRACPGTDRKPPTEITRVGQEEAYKKAVYLVQMKADGAMIRSFKEAARIDQAMQGKIESLVEDKLLRLYAHTQDQGRLSIAVKESLRHHSEALSAEQREQRIASGEGAGDVDWEPWLSVFRRSLNECASQFGFPGHIFLEKATSEMRRDATSIWQDVRN